MKWDIFQNGRISFKEGLTAISSKAGDRVCNVIWYRNDQQKVEDGQSDDLD